VIRIEHAPNAEEALDDTTINNNDEEWKGIAAEPGKTAVVRQLEELARSGAVKRERLQSDRETEWIESLVAKYGMDIGKMARDRKMNPYQKTEGDLRRRVAKWEKKQSRKTVKA
jgi:nucleolar protein 16